MKGKIEVVCIGGHEWRACVVVCPTGIYTTAADARQAATEDAAAHGIELEEDD